jgi:cytochrome P450
MDETISVSGADVCEWARTFTTYDPELQEDPYPILQLLREQCPVAFSEALGGYWVVSRYEDAHFVLTHPDIFSARYNAVPKMEPPEGLPKAIPSQFDGAEHTAYRQPMLAAFSPAAMARHEELVRRTVVELLEPIAVARHCEFVEDVAVPFPSRVFCEIAGLPSSGLDSFLRWKNTVLRATPEERPAAYATVFKELLAYFREVHAERSARDDPGDDFIGVLLSARVDGRPLTLPEFLSAMRLLFLAGLDTVTNQLSLAVHHLATHAHDRDELTIHPELIPGAVEELMRYDSIVNMARVVTREVTVRGVTCQPGDSVLVLTGSAGRDDEQFPGADRVELRREPNRHLGFGMGPHRCLGSHLARMEMRIALEEVHRRMPTYELDRERETRRYFGLVRGVETLPLRIG